jgi:hypothetical protein
MVPGIGSALVQVVLMHQITPIVPGVLECLLCVVLLSYTVVGNVIGAALSYTLCG